MISLENLRENINNLRTLGDNEEDILKAIDDIFYELIYTESTIFALFIGDQPFLAPTNQGGTQLFIRLFSHKELVDQDAETSSGKLVREVSVIETLQMAKTAFCKGAFGFILNEGDKWVVIPFLSYLRLFYDRILKDTSFYDEDDIQVIQFINEVKQNSKFRYALLPREDTDGYCSISRDDEDEHGRKDLSYEPLIISSLYHLPMEQVIIAIGDKKISTSRGKILHALSIMGLKDDDFFVVPEEYEDSLGDTIAEKLCEWRVQDISLTLKDQEKKVEDEITAEEQVQQPVPEMKCDGPAEKNASGDGHNAEDMHSQIGEKIKGFFVKETKEEADGQEKEPAIPIGSSLNKKHQGKLSFVLPHRRFAIAAVAVVILLAVCFGTGKIYLYNKALSDFKECIEDREIGEAYVIYQEHDLYQDAGPYLIKTIDDMVLKYAENRITAEELNAFLQVLTNFPIITSEIESARLTAAKIEESKAAYTEGKNTADVYTRLQRWQQVISLDSINYEAVWKDIEENEKKYEEVLLEEIDYYSTRVKDFAHERYKILSYWYPESEATMLWKEFFDSDESHVPLSVLPVSIQTIDIHQEPSGYWTLFIDWTNTSVKSIENIRFSLVSLDERGNIVTCTDTDGSWMVYDAEDPGPFAPGEGTPDKEHKWYRAWYGPNVATIKLTGLNIVYTDGSTATYTSEEDLAQLQSALPAVS